MTAQQVMDELLKTVETVTGKPALVVADANLRNHASIRIARLNEPAHLLAYNPKFKAELPYLACFQCGFALRMQKLPAERRFELSGTPLGRTQSRTFVLDLFRQQGKSLPTNAADQLAEQLYSGLMLQLRSMPIGIRVDTWIRTTFSPLHGMQEAAFRRQLSENAAALSPHIREFAPEKILMTSLGMSAAFAAAIGRLLDDESCVIPFRAAGHLGLGQELLDILDRLPDDPATDEAVIRAWGGKLALDGWFELIPLK